MSLQGLYTGGLVEGGRTDKLFQLQNRNPWTVFSKSKTIMRVSISSLLSLTVALLMASPAVAQTRIIFPKPSTNAPPPGPPAPTAFATVLELRYAGTVTENDARFTTDLEVESTGKGEATLLLFEGELAMPAPKLPQGLSIRRDANQYSLTIARPGKYKF